LQFPHDASSLIAVEMDRHVKDPRPYIYVGNAQGECYIYQVANLDAAFHNYNEDAPLPEAELVLIDIVLTKEPFEVRQVTKVGAQTFAIATENNKVHVVIHKPELK
jgi:hypothetical protein